MLKPAHRTKLLPAAHSIRCVACDGVGFHFVYRSNPFSTGLDRYVKRCDICHGTGKVVSAPAQLDGKSAAAGERLDREVAA